MIAYHYNTLRFFDGENNCQIDPRATQQAGKNIYLTPANCTLTKPEQQDGYTPRWNGKSWEQYPDDKIVYGYTDNTDGTINYYGSAHTEEQLNVKNPSVELSYTETEPVSVDGVYWLSADNDDYKKAKKEHDKTEQLAQLDASYSAQKQELSEQYTDDMLHGDTDAMESDKTAMTELDTWYDEEYAKIIEEG